VVVFAGRLIPEKRAPAVFPAVARARERVPELRCAIYGDGPERAEVERQGAQVHGFVAPEELTAALRGALCLLLPSRREGYGLIVVEAAAAATPSVLVAAPDNAATELVEDGVNGVVAPSASPEDLAEAVLRVHDGGMALRQSTADWFGRNASRLSLDASLERVVQSYRAA
jgi:glycosyltransferase involved in cell wall biosynthesis